MNPSTPSEAERRWSLPTGSFPFESRFVGVEGARLHYVDEGDGPTLLMLHGNPTWSFVYRHLITALRGEYRCLALDLAGFGLSTAPPGFSFKPRDHARLVTAALRALELRDATLIAHDWGGPIGIAAMAEAPGSVAALCLGNTWAWRVNGDFHFEWFSKLLGSPIGRWSAHRYAAFVNLLMPTMMRRRRLSAQEMAAYRAPFAPPADRTPLHVFPAEITGAGDWLETVERAARAFRGPVAFVWPDNDVAFRRKELDRWLTIYPHAEVEHIARCGHFPWEDAPAECIEALRRLLAARRP